MGNSCEYFIYAPQAAIGTFHPTAGDFLGLPADSAGPSGSQWETIEERVLGGGRALSDQQLGARAAGGSIIGKWPDANLATLIKTFMVNSITSGATNFIHGFLYKDTHNLKFFSAQMIYSPTMALSVLGGIVQSWEFAGVTKEKVLSTFNWEAKDIARSSNDSTTDGLFWYHAPAVNTPDIMQALPLTVYPTPARGLWFYDAVLIRDGEYTFNPVTNETVVAGSPVTLATVTSMNVVINHNLDTDGYSLVNDRTRQAFCAQNRSIEVSMSVRWCDQSLSLWDIANTDTPMALKATFLKSANLGVELYFPALKIAPHALPNLAGDKATRTIDFTARATHADVTNTTTGSTRYDFNLVVKNQEETI